MSSQMRKEIQIVEILRDGDTRVLSNDFTTEAQAKDWIMNYDVGDRMSTLTLMVRTIFTSARKK